MSRSFLVSLLLAVAVALLCLSSSSHAQSAGCTETSLDLYSIVSYTNTSLNTSALLFNISTRLGQDTYNFTLPSSYVYSYVYLQVGVAAATVNATFNVTVNNQPQVPSPYNATSSGTYVFVSGFYLSGISTAVNKVVITFYNNFTQCTFTDTFFITNPGAGLIVGGGSSSSSSTGAAGVRGDPQFVGLRGQSFQVHGMDGAVYALISDAHAQVNTRFVFLQGPRPCPVMPSTGKQATTCWTHAGSYLGELAVKTSAGDRVHVVAGSAVDGFSAVTVNGKAVSIEASRALQYLNTNVPAGLLIYNNTHELTLTTSHFTLTVENIDGFLNIRSLAVLDGSWPRLAAHGLLGQTWQWKRYSGKVKEIEGEVDDYVIDKDDLFGDSFVFSRFESEPHMQ